MLFPTWSELGVMRLVLVYGVTYGMSQWQEILLMKGRKFTIYHIYFLVSWLTLIFWVRLLSTHCHDSDTETCRCFGQPTTQ